MRTAETPAPLPPDTPLAEALTTDELVEIASLTAAQTGISGTIVVSTAMGSHRPRVKYYAQPGRTQPSFSVTIADRPAVVANSLPDRVLRQMSPPVIRWVMLNKHGLLDFWNQGDTWGQPQVNAFIQTLKRI